ncbi:hypothetical protein RFI_33630, partial [Reticulomyxa filosa]
KKGVDMEWCKKKKKKNFVHIGVGSYVQHLFSSPSLLTKPWFYELLVTSETKFFMPLKDFLQKKAQERLDNWKEFVEPKTMQLRSLRDLNESELYTFHTVHVVRRPSEQTRSLQHWALAFEGNNWLLRLEFSPENAIQWIL